MVEVTVFLEGGVLPNPGISAETINNSGKLRFAFAKLFGQAFPANKLNLSVFMMGPDKQAAKAFENDRKRGLDVCLWVDMEGPANQEVLRIQALGLTKTQEVFFMIQKMEAWILSQPESIEKALEKRRDYIRKDQEKQLENDESLADKHPSQIYHPDTVLKTLMGRYYEVEKRGRRKKLKYGKLKDAPSFIANLDLKLLCHRFPEVNRFVQFIENQLPH